MLKIDDEIHALIPPLTEEERKALAQSLFTEGVRVPLDVWLEEDVLLDGHNRYEIATQHGLPFKTNPLSFPSRTAAKVWVIRNQFARRNLTPYQRGVLALILEPLLVEEAKARQRTSTGGAQPQLRENLPQAEQKGRTRGKIAEAARVSDRTLDKIKHVEAKAPEELKAKARIGDVSIDAAYKEVRGIEKAEAKAAIVEKITAEPLPFPEGPFRVIVVDPPWPYESRAEDPTHRARNPYPSMSLGDIADLPVASISHEDSILWLWTTNAFIYDAFNLCVSWGFTQKTILTWAKDRIGLGNWLRGQTEHCILAVKGSPVITLTNQSTLLNAPVREHSRKPDEFYALVDSLCPGSKLEMFARQQRDEWQSWGAESEF